MRLSARFINTVTHLAAIPLFLGLSGCVSTYSTEVVGWKPESQMLAEFYESIGVSMAVRSGNMLYVGGVVAFSDTVELVAPNDPVGQTEVVYSRLKTILNDHGATFRNVVNETIYVNDLDDFDRIQQVRIRHYRADRATFPPLVGAEVKLWDERAVLEVQLVAALSEGS